MKSAGVEAQAAGEGWTHTCPEGARFAGISGTLNSLEIIRVCPSAWDEMMGNMRCSTCTSNVPHISSTLVYPTFPQVWAMRRTVINRTNPFSETMAMIPHYLSLSL